MFHSCFGSGWPRRYAYASARTPGAYAMHMENRHHERGGRSGRGARGGGFGVRRPLRYLSYRLDLDDAQTRQLAKILDRLKTEQAQAAVDEDRSMSRVADLVTRPDLALDDVRAALDGRVDAAERLRTEAARAIQEIAALLDEDQREEFAYLLSSKAIAF